MSESLTLENEKALIEKAQQGDQAAFGLLLTHYQPRVKKLLLRYIKDASEVEDLSQEIFLKAFHALPQFRGDSRFYTWLFRITLNSAKNYFTKQQHSVATISAGNDEQEDAYIQTLLKELDNPEEELVSDEVKKLIFQALKDMPDDLKICLILREFEGYSYEKIAHIMDCPVGTIRSRIFRARDLLNEKLKTDSE